MERGDYYAQVSAYFDADADDFQGRYEANPVLRRLREDFRRITERRAFQSALEIGCGPGIDLAYFARKYPEREICGIDIAPRMVERARRSIAGLANARAEVGSAEDLGRLFGGRTFDLVYCYFGALNTVFDLSEAARALRRALADDGVAVLTFVNRWYLFDIAWNLARGRWRRAFERVTGAWRGYSPKKELESTARSPREIARHFAPWFRVAERRGYSIVYPAWYRAHRLRPGGRAERLLWRADAWANRTPARDAGEYSLYVLEPITAAKPSASDG